MFPCLLWVRGRTRTAPETLGEPADRRRHNLCLSRGGVKHTSFWTWKYCLYVRLPPGSAGSSAVTRLQPFSALSAWIFFTGRFLELGSHRMVLVTPSPFSTRRAAGSRTVSRLWGRAAASVPTGCQGRGRWEHRGPGPVQSNLL